MLMNERSKINLTLQKTHKYIDSNISTLYELLKDHPYFIDSKLSNMNIAKLKQCSEVYRMQLFR